MLIVHVFAAKFDIGRENREAYPPDSCDDEGLGFISSGEALSAGVIQAYRHLAVADGRYQFREIRIAAYIAISFDNDRVRCRTEGLSGRLEDQLIQGPETGFNLHHLPGAIVASPFVGFASPASGGLYSLDPFEVTEAAEAPAIQAGSASYIHNYFHCLE